ncbi:MAG: class I SAM-dependent methyltransferase, partial [Gammaproteobacteria bacterium]
GDVLDLGCGPADVTIRFAKHFPESRILAVDGAEAMLEHGKHAVEMAGLSELITLQKAYLPQAKLPAKNYRAIISNSLLHHLEDPHVLWTAIKQYGSSETRVFIMDLMRPRSESAARDLVEEYAGNEPDILKRDFFHSLLAAYTIGEVESQLEKERLIELSVKPVSDRHLVVSGVLW